MSHIGGCVRVGMDTDCDEKCPHYEAPIEVKYEKLKDTARKYLEVACHPGCSHDGCDTVRDEADRLLAELEEQL